jgi:hypothetical protein
LGPTGTEALEVAEARLAAPTLHGARQAGRPPGQRWRAATRRGRGAEMAEQEARPWQRQQELRKRTTELLAQREEIAAASEVALELAKINAHDAEERAMAAHARMSRSYAVADGGAGSIPADVEPAS